MRKQSTKNANKYLFQLGYTYKFNKIFIIPKITVNK